MREMSLEDLHDFCLGIAKDIHQFCVKNKLRYSLGYGSLIGAVRHKGFIPWDDDMDFGVERKYFDKLDELFNKQTDSPYRMRTLQNSKTIINDPGKMEDTRTIIIEPERANIKEEIGINIDIFPLDITNGKKGLFSKNNLVHLVGLINTYRYCNIKVLKGWHRFFALAFRVVFAPFGKSSLLNFARKYLIPQKGDHISNLYGFWGVRETIPRSVMGKPVKYQFEDTFLYGVEDYDAYLTSLYKDYMVIPPEEKIHVHLDNAFRKE